MRKKQEAGSRWLRAEGAESRGRERRRQEVGSRKQGAESRKRRVRCMSGELDAECIKQEAESLMRRAGSRKQIADSKRLAACVC